METSPQIPLLNTVALHNLKDGCLVRFRGMIQDMHNPEFYFETFEIFNKVTNQTRIASGKYKDTADIGESETIDYTSPKLKSAERQSIKVISLPGFNNWARTIENAVNVAGDSIKPSIEPKSGLKRSLESTECDEEMDTADSSKEIRTDAPPDTSKVGLSREHMLNFPLPDDDGKVCIVKIYDGFEGLKINDTIEITGYLSVNPALSEQWNRATDESDNTETDAETLTHNPPPSLIPRIHATEIKKLRHCNPLLDENFNKQTVLDEANEAREHFHKVLTQILFGDSLAADYLICHLISHVYIRKDLVTLGKLALNLWNVPCQQHPMYVDQIYSIIEKLVTKSHFLPLTIDNLNDLAFTPKKDYECNRLTSGLLQLSENTHLILDETKMSPGKLNNSGVLNLATLGNVIQMQRVSYDFKYYNMQYDCDIPVLVLSEGKSLLPNDISLPLVVDESSLKITNEIFEAANHYLNQDVLEKIRKYITNMKLIEFTIAEEPEYVQEDFVNMRKSDGKEVSAEDLHRLLVLTRLICISRGYDTINKECWEIAKQMEDQRSARLK